MLARIGLAVLAFTFSSVVLAKNIVKEYPVKDFSEFVVSGETQVEITQTDEEYLKIEADAEIMKHVKVDQTGKRVSVWAKKDGNFFNWFSNHDSMKIKVTLRVKNLEYLELSGASTAEVGDLKAKSFYLGVSGAANGNFTHLNTDKLKVNLSGAANFRIDTVNSLEQVYDLSGAANMDVRSASSTNKLSAGASGASNIRAKKLIAKHANLEASGASHIAVSVTDELHAEASGASHINYIGSPKTKTNASGASHINGESND
jgi:hypothetical protein